jgi:methyl-accepting chemotaxis protein
MSKAALSSEKILSDFEQTGKMVNDISSEISSANEIVSSNSRSVEEISAAAEHLDTMTNKLNQKMEQFKL